MITDNHKNGSRRQLVPTGIEERWATVNGHRMRYLFGGSGPPLLLVHGLMGFSFSWSENLSAFAENFTVYAPDLLNVGYSGRCYLDPDLSTTASQLLQFMDAVGIEVTDLLGTSYGGTLAMALAASAPPRINRLILVAPAHCGSEGNRWQSHFFSSRPGGIVAQLIHLAPAFVHAYFIKRMYSKPSRALPGTVEEYSAALRSHGTIAPIVKLMHCWTRNFAALASMMPSIANIPTLLVWGKNDYVVPIQTMDSLVASFRSVGFAFIDDAGHLPYEEKPEEFNEIVLSFLKRPWRAVHKYSFDGNRIQAKLAPEELWEKCAKCAVSIPRFLNLPQDLDLELRQVAEENSPLAFMYLQQTTDCGESIAKAWTLHLHGPVKEDEVVPCPKCGKALRTPRAKQCRFCRSDWH